MKTKLEIIKIKGEINKIESKITMGLINKTRSWYFEKTNRQSTSQFDSKKESRKLDCKYQR